MKGIFPNFYFRDKYVMIASVVNLLSVDYNKKYSHFDGSNLIAEKFIFIIFAFDGEPMVHEILFGTI